MIKFINVSKIYKKRFKKIKALTEFSYEFLDSGFYTLIGESGSGKSTILNLSSFLDYPNEGEIYFNDKLVNKKDTIFNDKLRRDNFSIVYEEKNLMMNDTLFNNILYSLKFNNKKLSYKKLFYFMDYLSLKKELLDEKVKNLSGGEQKRVTILRALMNDNKVILMDEPTSSLDYDNAVNIFEILKDLSKDRLIIIATHDTKLAYKYCDFVLSLNKGILTKEEKIENKADEKDNIPILFDDEEEIKGVKLNLIKKI